MGPNLTPEEEAMNEAASILLLLKQAPGKQLEEVTTSSTLEEEVEALQEDDELELLPPKKRKASKSQLKEVKVADQADKKQSKKRKVVEEDDSEEIRELLLQWNNNTPEIPPGKIVDAVVEVCSEPMRKQLTESDVKEDQCRLMLRKKQVDKMMLQVMGKSEKLGKHGLEVSVYGPDGKVYKMMFKIWNEKTPVLTSTGWRKFVGDYGLNMHSDFLTIWMFKHKETRKICFAIDFTRFPLEKPLSRRILKVVFLNPN